MKHETHVEILKAAAGAVTGLEFNFTESFFSTWIIVCGGVRDAAHLLLAVKLAARETPGSLFFRLVGESMLPVLRELECWGKALG